MSKHKPLIAAISGCAIAFALSTGPVLAQGRGQGRGAPPAPKAGKPTTPPPKAGPSTEPKAPKAAPPVTRGPGAPLTIQPKLAAKLQPLLPGLDVSTAAQGFRNLGQFVAAVHVSNNLEIPFETLKTRMVTDGLSLGQAIQATKPAVNFSVEARRAERQAKVTIDSGGK